jgi:hypothetical protein
VCRASGLHNCASSSRILPTLNIKVFRTPGAVLQVYDNLGVRWIGIDDLDISRNSSVNNDAMKEEDLDWPLTLFDVVNGSQELRSRPWLG